MKKGHLLFPFLTLGILFYGLGIFNCSKKRMIDPYVPGATVWGMLTLPEIADGKPYAVYLDSDTILTNVYIQSQKSICRYDSIVPYDFYDVPSGIYYLYGIVWMNGGEEELLRHGDFFGYYGGADGTPDSANVVIPSSGKVVLSFKLNVFRE